MSVVNWFYEKRHAMCATPDTVWSRIAHRYMIDCPCCTFWRGMLIGGLSGAICGLMIAVIIG
jgi:hypothetical protein